MKTLPLNKKTPLSQIRMIWKVAIILFIHYSIHTLFYSYIIVFRIHLLSLPLAWHNAQLNR